MSERRKRRGQWARDAGLETVEGWSTERLPGGGLRRIMDGFESPAGSKTTWRIMIDEEMEKHGDDWGGVVHVALQNQEWDEDFEDPPPIASLDTVFGSDFGAVKGCYFTLWTDARVYFPCCYDGAEWCGSVPRNPCDEASKHKGGG